MLVQPHVKLIETKIQQRIRWPSGYHRIVGLVVEFVVAIDEARVRFTDDAFFCFCLLVFEIASLYAWLQVAY